MEQATGQDVTMEESTRQLYRKVYFRLERRARMAYGIHQDEAVTPQQVAATFVDNEAGWERSTARLYRASLVFVFKEMNDFAGKEACDMVYHIEEDGEWRMQIRERVNAERKKRKRSSPRTSAQKAKSMKPEDMALLRAALEESRSQWARDTRLWFFAGVLTGLRPTEWQRAELGINEAGSPILIVRNAKNTNGRAHGARRTLILAQMSESNIALIAAHIQRAQVFSNMGAFESYYYNCRRLLRLVADRLWPRRIKHPTLYTARHVFSGDAKQSFDRIAVAAMMGHASVDTAYEHYGKRHSGSGGMGVAPSDDDLMAVAKRNPQYNPGEPASEGSPRSKFSRVYGGENDASNKG
jgi:hypothetical protein